MNPDITEETPLSLLISSEELEDVNEFRENAVKFLRLMQEAVLFIASAENPKFAAIGVGYALAVPSIVEVSMRERSRNMGISHNSLSVYKQKFKEIAAL